MAEKNEALIALVECMKQEQGQLEAENSVL